AMFAFGLFDAQEGALYLVRDRAGKKPLYYCEAGGRIAFASELRGLLPLLDFAPELDPEGLDAYLTLKFVPAPGTLLQKVRRVRPGTYMRFQAGQPAAEVTYWTPFAAPEPAPPVYDDLVARTGRVLSTAVERRLVSDVPICVFLSGGVDSSLMVAMLDQVGARGLATYTIGYDALPEYNEYEYARMVAGRYRVDYRELQVTAADVLATLEAEPPLDEPISDWVWVPLHFLSRQAHADGYKVALVGEGADEIFFGYEFMRRGLKELAAWRRPGWKAMAQLAATLLAPVYRFSYRGHRRYDRWRRVAAGEPVYLGSSVGFGASQRHQVAGPLLRAAPATDPGGRFIAGLHADYERGSGAPLDDVNRIAYVEFFAKMSEVLLPRVDRVSMWHSLEARAPFIDHELVELAFAAPGSMKYRAGRLKALLKDVARPYLPAPVIERKKMGFSFPFKEWLRGSLGGVIEDALARGRIFADGWLDRRFATRLLGEHRRGLVDHAPRLWALYSLTRWYDRWV
ncbi:MAG TPA: asparagine synthase (glutamine-hydrolyzing), partial [Candidatus Udaeobacter sp.]|nr:asparagine synthase (glutamine-hydrolyzing) [Candidatus Udaeobacter sp.]